MKRNIMKILALMLALMLVLCACGESEEQVGGNVTPIATETPATEVPEAQMSLGQIEGGIYANSYLDLQIVLDSSWVYKSAEELQELPTDVADLFKDTELAEDMAGLQQFTDMMAESVEQMASINVLFQKLDMKTRLAYAALSEEQIIDATMEQADVLRAAYTAAGIMVEKMEKVTVTFMGQERTAIKTTASIQDIPYFTLQIFEFKRGQYSATITLATYLEDNTESLLDLCSPIA